MFLPVVSFLDSFAWALVPYPDCETMLTKAIAAALFGAGRGITDEILTTHVSAGQKRPEARGTNQARLQLSDTNMKHVTRNKEKYRAPTLRVLARMIRPTKATHMVPTMCQVFSFLTPDRLQKNMVVANASK